MIRIILGFLFSFFISFIAYKKNSLSLSGSIAAIILGTLLYRFGSMYFWSILIAFFISATLLTKFKSRDKKALDDISEKAGARDYIQVMANGGLGLIYAILYYFSKEPVYLIAYAVSFSAANSDTWSSEVGVLSKADPISIITFRKTSKGESGAISPLGTMAAFSGSLFIAVVFFIEFVFSFVWTDRLLFYSLIVLFCGFMGSIFDSILGATLQAKYSCKSCGKVTEKRNHHGQPTTLIKGMRFMTNDAVNLISFFLASLLAILIYIRL